MTLPADSGGYCHIEIFDSIGKPPGEYLGVLTGPDGHTVRVRFVIDEPAADTPAVVPDPEE